MTGSTGSTKFPTLNPFQTDQGDMDLDVLVTKLSSSGSSLIYSTYIGGGKGESGAGIAIDSDGNAYVTGYTESSDFPTQNPYETTHQGGVEDVFVTKLSSGGNVLIYCTYLGGDSFDDGSDIAVDGSGSAFVMGFTWSLNFPTLNPYQTGQGGVDAFVTKLSEFQYLCGDANGDVSVNVSDAVRLIAYIFSGGPAPRPLEAGDCNCDLTVNISDAVYSLPTSSPVVHPPAQRASETTLATPSGELPDGVSFCLCPAYVLVRREITKPVPRARSGFA